MKFDDFIERAGKSFLASPLGWSIESYLVAIIVAVYRAAVYASIPFVISIAFMFLLKWVGTSAGLLVSMILMICAVLIGTVAGAILLFGSLMMFDDILNGEMRQREEDAKSRYTK